MPVSVRLDEETKHLLEKTAKIMATTKTNLIKTSIREYCARMLGQYNKTPYDLLQDLVNEKGSGMGDLSIKDEEILRKRWARK